MNREIYMLEEVFFDSVDPIDGERKEIRLTDGFWANRRKMLAAKARITKNLNEGWTLETTAFAIPMRKRQVFLYVLNYEYFDTNGTCFYYQFEPCTSRRECQRLKMEKLLDSKYCQDPSKTVRRGEDGWFIEKYQIVY